MRKLWWMTLVAAVVMATQASSPANAQEAGFPPWPIIYDGTAELDGAPVANGTLTARVGDWTSVAVPVVDGAFRCADPCLIVGPPSFDYIGAQVTFHLEGVGRAATLKFDYPNLAEPSRRTEALVFTTGAGVPLWLLGIIGVMAIAVLGGVAGLMFRGGSSD